MDSETRNEIAFRFLAMAVGTNELMLGSDLRQEALMMVDSLDVDKEDAENFLSELSTEANEMQARFLNERNRPIPVTES